MDHQVPVGVMHCLAHAREQRGALAQAELHVGAVLVDRYAVAVFHDEEAAAVVAAAGVDQARDVGMVQRRQQFALALKARLDVGRLRAGLARSWLPVWPIAPSCRSTSSTRPMPSRPSSRSTRQCPARRPAAARRSAPARLGSAGSSSGDSRNWSSCSMRGEQRTHQVEQVGFAFAGVGDKLLAFVGWQVERAVQQRVGWLMQVSGHRSVRSQFIAAVERKMQMSILS